MRAHFLPIVQRELRLRSRENRTYRVRTFVALGAYLLAVLILLGSRGASNGGEELFSALFYCSLIFALLVGARATADCLSSERREGTLGLLFLTRLKGHDVVLGKMAATGLISVYSLVSVFPILGLAFLAGGVMPAELVRAVLVLLNSVFFALAAGLWISARSIYPGRAMAGTFALLIGLVGGVPLLDWSLMYHDVWSWKDFFSLAGSVYYSAERVFNREYSRWPEGFWLSLLLTHLVAWIFLIRAGVRAQSDWDAASGDWAKASLGEARRARGGPAERENPIFWAATRVTPSTFWFWLIFSVGLTTIWWSHFHERRAVALVVPAIVAAMCRLSILAAACWSCCGWLQQTRRAGTFELILTTPTTFREILQGHDLAQRQLLFWPAMSGVVLEVFSMINRFLFYYRELPGAIEARAVAEAITAHTASLIIFFLDLYAITRLGTLLTLRSPHPATAPIQTFLVAVLLPWFIYTLLFSNRFFFTLSWSSWPGMVFLLIKDLAIIVLAGALLRRLRNDLEPSFREKMAAAAG